MRSPSWLRTSLSVVLGAALAAPASATWSIVFVNKATGEVAVGTATCLANFDIQQTVPVVRVGEGVGAAQSLIDANAANRRILRNGLRDGLTPLEIRQDLIANGSQPGRRQYGIAAFSGPASTWTGAQAGAAAFGVTGEVDDLSYAIQGNLLVADQVVLAAEEALRNTKGDSGQRLLAAMKAAARLGGDGRCSCDDPDPTACGSPPDPFTKSAHAGTIIVARLGDPNSGCNAASGCASEDYYLTLNVIGDEEDPDPVLELQRQYESWRAELLGRPDGVRSTLTSSADRAPADGVSTIEVRVTLADVEGLPLGVGGALLDVQPSGANPSPLFAVSPVTDNGDGTYAFTLTSGTTTGSETFTITADDGTQKATLVQTFSPEVVAPSGLTVGSSRVSVSEGRGLALVVNEPLAAGAPFVILGSRSGTRPGFAVAGLTIPLNPDAWFVHTLLGGSDLIGTMGRLDGSGRAQGAWRPRARGLAPLAGVRFHWSALVLGTTPTISPAQRVELVP